MYREIVFDGFWMDGWKPLIQPTQLFLVLIQNQKKNIHVPKYLDHFQITYEAGFRNAVLVQPN